ncbi:cupin [Virgisporangium aliadipatigenens]|uniref:Cupin n=1 Tax=Virgisporangium aliadipatigenens TaxID=741659 RepID=A0A8J3YRS7_9ACTN|nr:cupin domain-containing protein [Virgisporangium aliadipatigenens]GIJ50674.1 cupin [Virgisporangium aliadipatigenens]
MPLTRHDEAVEQPLHGFTFRSLARTDRGSSALAVWRIHAPAHAASPAHAMSEEEVVVVQRGRFVATIGDEQWEAGPGDALIVPAGTPFRLTNPFDEPAEALACTRLGMAATIDGASVTPPWTR